MHETESELFGGGDSVCVCVCVGGSGGVDGGESIRDYICQNFGFSSTYLRRAYAELWIVL